MKRKSLKIINARENNLKGFDLEISHDKFTVVTGLSGSGKSSLAFDTVYAEGQRRYIETFSPYTRQFFDKVKRPSVDSVQNVRPAVAIQQRTRINNSRSTVGSLTNIIDYLKILWSNISEAKCPSCGITLESWTAETLSKHVAKLVQIKNESTFLVCARLAVAPGKLSAELTRLITLGFSRIYNTELSEVQLIDDFDSKKAADNREVILVLDRISSKSSKLSRLRDSIDQAFTTSGGSCLLIEIKDRQNIRPYLQVVNNEAQLNRKAQPNQYLEFFNSFRCFAGDINIERPKPSLFSHNHPAGACPECKGFGRILTIDPDLCVPDTTKSIEEKAIQCWAGEAAKGEFKRLLKFCEAQNISTTAPWRKLKENDRNKIFNHKSKDFRGVLTWFKRLERKAYKMHVRVFLARYRTPKTCDACGGSRLKKAALAYEVADRNLPAILNMPIGNLLNWLKEVESSVSKSSKYSREIKYIFLALHSRLQYLVDLGLSYLTLDRQARTLSGGETQRVNLGTALGSELISTQFVLDEPSVGLHARDTGRLVKALQNLSAKRNSLLVVEHDLDCINAAENIIEIGPKAGEQGGQVVYSGPAAKWSGVKLDKELLTPRKTDKDFSKLPAITITNAKARNLKGFNTKIPLSSLVCLTGVSGSGKSTLVSEIIKDSYERYLKKDEEKRSENIAEGFAQVSQILVVDQSPLAKSPRANIATYSGIWDEVRAALADTDEAKSRALSKSAFSFNVDGGRCPNCKGAGFITEDMQFLSDVYVPCELCLGKRFQEPVLEVRYLGKNAHEYLQMSVEECSRVMHKKPRIIEAADILCQLGLGHLTLGHPLSELSGGEAQRLKLVPFLQQASGGNSLLIFDEPTTGLHAHDVENLIRLLRVLCDKGHSILCIEHNLSLIAASDWIIDLGPEGGDEGGYLVWEGTPYDLINASKKLKIHSYTQAALKDFCESSFKTSKKNNVAVLPEKNDPEVLKIIGAKEHNLKNLDIEVPLGKIIALSGVSGSGKSSIAKDIIYAEGQRRFLDCLSPYARQFIKELKRPDIEEIRNVQPTICVYQHTFQPSRLSTVATMSEIYNFLRLLYSKIGMQYCPDHPTQQISPLSAEEMAREIKSYKGATLRILAPVIKLKKGHHNEVLNRAIESDISEVRVDGLFGPPSRFLDQMDKRKPHSVDFVVGKLNPANVDLELIRDAVSQALSLGGGNLMVHTQNSEEVFSQERTCPKCKRGFFKPDPEDLSFNSKRGVCSACQGTGINKRGNICPVCDGSRLNALGSNIRLGGKNIHEAAVLNGPALREFIQGLRLSETQAKLCESIFLELNSKISSLIDIGLDYLSLDRDCTTLSGGELQRLRLATAMGSPLSGVMYIFDEPSAGLHPFDNVHILTKLKELKDHDNSVIIIEHDISSIVSADYVIDIGPGGGSKGGEIVFQGDTDKFIKDKNSATAIAVRESFEKKNLSVKTKKSEIAGTLTVTEGEKHNVRCRSLKIPLGQLVAVGGVSGAGKSSLVHGIIADTINLGKGNKSSWSYEGNKVASSIDIERALFIDQKPIGINSRSTPASYLKIWDEIRKVFASTIEAKARGWTASHFSYNTGKGRCPDCKGQGQIKLEMNFLPDAYTLCETCGGSRFQEETNSIHYLGLSVSDVLNLTFEQAKPIFANHRKIYHSLVQACDIGLGYLTLGQSSVTLSGGESQRIKLVSELSSSRKGHTLYILDEPTTGLHRNDVARLLKILQDLVAKNNSVLIIEHDEEVIFSSDYFLELGPGPGEDGGKIIFEGSPDKLTKSKTPWGSIYNAGGISAALSGSNQLFSDICAP